MSVTYLEEDEDEEELIDHADTQPKPPVSCRETQGMSAALEQTVS